jgi:hypothetical protein
MVLLTSLDVGYFRMSTQMCSTSLVSTSAKAKTIDLFDEFFPSNNDPALGYHQCIALGLHLQRMFVRLFDNATLDYANHNVQLPKPACKHTVITVDGSKFCAINI